jgi:hypothetical protein
MKKQKQTKNVAKNDKKSIAKKLSKKDLGKISGGGFKH